MRVFFLIKWQLSVTSSITFALRLFRYFVQLYKIAVVKNFGKSRVGRRKVIQSSFDIDYLQTLFHILTEETSNTYMLDLSNDLINFNSNFRIAYNNDRYSKSKQ